MIKSSVPDACGNTNDGFSNLASERGQGTKFGPNLIMNKSIGQKIRELRERDNLTQQELADDLGCAQTTVANWENQDSRAPDRKTMAKIARQFGVTLDYLLGIESVENDSIPCYGKAPTRGFVWSELGNSYPLKVSSDEYFPDCFALKILDNDLEPFILEDDYGIFRKISPKDGDITVVRLEQKDIALIRKWRCKDGVITLLPTNPYAREGELISPILKHESETIKLLPEGKLIVEGVFIGIKRIWKSIS